MAVGSGANFTATTSSTAVAAAGNLTMTNSKSATTIFNVTNMKPSDTQSGTVTLTNTGSVAANFSATMGSISNIAGTGGGLLGSKLNLRVIETNAAGTTEIGSALFNATINTWSGAIPLANLAPAASKTYKFEVYWAPDTSTDNNYQSGQVTMPFSFDAIQS
jgi:hypothetical protein